MVGAVVRAHEREFLLIIIAHLIFFLGGCNFESFEKRTPEKILIFVVAILSRPQTYMTNIIIFL